MVDRLVDTIIARKTQGYVTSEPPEFYEAMRRYVRGEKGFWECDAGRYHLTINNNGKVMQCALLTDDLGIHFRELDRDYAERLAPQFDLNLAVCNDRCLPAAYFCSSHYRRHPSTFIGFARQKFG